MSAEAAERRIPIGPLVGLAGALLLLVSLFLDWWEGATAFTVFEVLDLVLAGLALAAIASLAQGLGAQLPPPAPDAPLALPLSAAALAIVVSQMLNDPPAIAGTGHGPAVGMWIALGGAMLMVAGGALAAARIKLALDLERREPARRRREPSEPSEPSEPGTGESAAARMRARAAARAAGAEAAEPSPDGPDAPQPEPDEPTAPLREPERPGGG